MKQIRPHVVEFVRWLTVGSKTYGWEEEVVGLGADIACDSVGGRFLEVSD